MKKFDVFVVSCILLSTTVALVIRYDDIDGCIGDICYEDPSYPHKEIEDMWTKSSNAYSRTFGDLYSRSEQNKIEGTPTCELCQMKINLKVQLLSIVDQNERLYVTRTQKYNPQIKVQVCSEDADCELKSRPNDYFTSCVQQISTLNLLAYNSTSKEFISRTVRYPSGCECALYHSS